MSMSMAVFVLLSWTANAQDGKAITGNKVKSIDHVVINVADMERALAFYKRLGFALINEDGWRKGRGQVALRIGENQKLNIHKEEVLSPQAKFQDTGANDKLSLAKVAVAGSLDFCVVWDGTVEEAQQHLKASGVEPISPPRNPTGARGGPSTSIYFRDPDGNLWEYMIYGK